MMLTDIVSMDALNDSIAKVIPIIESIEENSAPAPFTYINIAIAVLAALFGWLGAHYGKKGYIFSQKTAENVSRRSTETQRALYDAFIKDLQVNMVRSVELEYRRTTAKPITENFLGLMRLPDAETVFPPEIYNQDPAKYMEVYNLLCKIRTYGEAVSIAQSHIINNSRLEEQDIEDIASKNANVLRQCVFSMQKVVNYKYDFLPRMIKTHTTYVNAYAKYLYDQKANDELEQIQQCLSHDTLKKAIYRYHSQLLEKWYDDAVLYVSSPLKNDDWKSLPDGDLKSRLMETQWKKEDAYALLRDLICYSAYIDYCCSVDKTL